MKILKFGGSSISNIERIFNVISIIKNSIGKSGNIIVVFSALQEVTDKLSSMGKKASMGEKEYSMDFEKLYKRHTEIVETLAPGSNKSELKDYIDKLFFELDKTLYGIYLVKELTVRTLDFLQSFGELLSGKIMYELMISRGINCEYVDARKLIITDYSYGKASVNFEISNRKIIDYFAKHNSTQIITGFIASTISGDTTTLGRGGSDLTASIIGAALNVEEIQIWTDVDGILTADPRKVKNPISLKAVTYNEAAELSYFGAKVLYPPTVLPAHKNKIKVRIKNSLNPEFRGTVILEKEKSIPFNLKGISSIDEIVMIRFNGKGIAESTSIASRLFGVLSENNINIILISHSSSGENICFAIAPEEKDKSISVFEKEFKVEITEKKIDKPSIIENLSIIAIVGEDLIQTSGIAGKIFETLGKNKINIYAIAQGFSELNLSIVIDKNYLNRTLNILHEALFNIRDRRLLSECI